jgi:hypothetical protein
MDGARSAQSRSRQRESHSADQRAPGVRPLLQSARATRHRRQGQRRQVDRLGHAPFEHRHARRLLHRALSRIGSCDSFINRELPDSEQSLQSRVCAAWWNWQEYLEEIRLASLRVIAQVKGHCAGLCRRLREETETTLRRIHFRISPPRIRR